MRIGGQPTKNFISIQAPGGILILKEDKEEMISVKLLPPEKEYFNIEKQHKEPSVFSGLMWTAPGSHYVAVHFSGDKFIIMAMPGHNPYGISSPMLCSDREDGDNLYTADEVWAYMKKNKAFLSDMRCDAVPGRCGWYKGHLEDNENRRNEIEEKENAG